MKKISLKQKRRKESSKTIKKGGNMKYIEDKSIENFLLHHMKNFKFNFSKIKFLSRPEDEETSSVDESPEVSTKSPVFIFPWHIFSKLN